MQKQSYIQISSLIVILSILTMIAQFSIYCLVASPLIIIMVSIFAPIISAQILLSKSLSYEPVFSYSLLSVFVSGIIMVLTFVSKEVSLFPYSELLLLMVIINWLIPRLFSLIHSMFDQGLRFKSFKRFYRNSSILFMIFYLALFIYCNFVTNSLPSLFPVLQHKENLIPFYGVATLIEGYIYGNTLLNEIFLYLGFRILFYIPFGYYISLLWRQSSKWVKVLLFVLIPFLTEVAQYFIYIERCDIDDIIYALLGSILGYLLFTLTNWIFRFFSGRNFLENDSYGYTSRSLHF